MINIKNTNRLVNLVAVVSGLYVSAQILADILSLRIVNLFGFSIDGGTFIYPLTFTIRDLLHRVAGKYVARTVVLLAAAINLFMILAFWAIAYLPADVEVGPQVEFGIVLLPFWRIVLASILAEVISELLDGEMYEKWTNWYGETKIWGRVVFSNLFSIPVDSLIFTSIAFLGEMPLSVLVSIFFSNVIIKYVVGTLSLPIIYVPKN